MPYSSFLESYYNGSSFWTLDQEMALHLFGHVSHRRTGITVHWLRESHETTAVEIALQSRGVALVTAGGTCKKKHLFVNKKHDLFDPWVWWDPTWWLHVSYYTRLISYCTFLGQMSTGGWNSLLQLVLGDRASETSRIFHGCFVICYASQTGNRRISQVKKQCQLRIATDYIEHQEINPVKAWIFQFFQSAKVSSLFKGNKKLQSVQFQFNHYSISIVFYVFFIFFHIFSRSTAAKIFSPRLVVHCVLASIACGSAHPGPGSCSRRRTDRRPSRRSPGGKLNA